MYCPNCGAQVPDSAAFCPNCGTRLSVQAAPAPTPAPAEPVAPAAPAAAPEPVQAPDYGQQAYQQVPDYGQQASYQQVPDYGQQPFQPSYQQIPQQTPMPQAAPQAAASGGFTFKMPSSLSDLFTSYNKAGVQYAESTGLQMKWYKALTIALLYIAAVFNLFSAFQYFSGSIYDGSASYLYSSHPALRIVDILYGIYCLALSAVALYVRMRLAKFATDGPRLYLGLLLVNGCATVIYSILLSAIMGYSDFATILGSVIGVGIMYVLNRTYFGKRQHLFTMAG